ncbi:hypothetical protein [Actinacidiphila sp. bgisy160]|uniref:hypothetical protein n=1 Tax=Actinacidiphila sp. bgisy160 TaxID=3413796 RepID=UPI003D710AB9
MTTTRGALTALGCLTAALTIAACGPLDSTAEPASTALADQPSATIEKKAVAAMKSAPAMTVALDGISDGERMKFRMTMSTAGDCKGEVTVEGGTVRLVKAGPSLYMKGDDAFWKAQGSDGAAMKELLGDRWMKTKADTPDNKDLVEACDLDAFLAELEKDSDGDLGGKKGEPATLAGTPAVPITSKDGAETTTAYVATEGKPYVLKVVVKGGKEPGTMLFSDFDKPVEITAPAAKDAVDIDKLAG